MSIDMLISVLAARNPGALTALKNVYASDTSDGHTRFMEFANVLASLPQWRSGYIYCAFADVCQKNENLFMELVISKDATMFEQVENYMKKGGQRPTPHISLV